MRPSLLPVTFLLLCAAHRASATVVLDQEHNTPTSVADSTNGSVSEVAQTFTVGVAGTLHHIEVSMFQLGGIFATNGDPKLSVYNTAAGVPTGSPLTTVQIPSAMVPFNTAAFISFDVSGAAIPVSVGQVFAFGVSTLSDPGPYFLPDDQDFGAADDYKVGAAYRRTLPSGPWQLLGPVAQDHEFRTYVDTVAALLTGDVNSDHVVNQLDLNVVFGNWLSTGATLAQGDANGDGVVNQLDINTITGNWLATGPAGGSSANSIPEPSTGILALIAGGFLLRRSRKGACAV